MDACRTGGQCIGEKFIDITSIIDGAGSLSYYLELAILLQCDLWKDEKK